MLKLLVCVKQVPDVDQMKMDPDTGNLIRDGVEAIMNPLDANALSAAVSVKEDYGGALTAITMGPPAASTVLRECIAVGADAGVLVSDRAFSNADTLATSYSIASAANSLGSFDIIFCGRETLDGATGQMGPQLAERFDAAQVSAVVLIKSIDEDKRIAVVERELDTGLETLEVSLPCVFIMEKRNYPVRIPNLKGKLASKKAQLTVLTASDIPGLDLSRIGDSGSPTKVPYTFPPVMPEPGVILDEGDLSSTVDRLFAVLED